MARVERGSCPFCGLPAIPEPTAPAGAVTCPLCLRHWWFIATPKGPWFFDSSAEHEAILRFIEELLKRLEPALSREEFEERLRDLEDRFPGPDWEGYTECWTCTHFQRGPGGRRDGLRPGICRQFSKPIPDGRTCVCRAWFRTRGVTPMMLERLDDLQPGKLYVISGSYERFDEIDDLF